jgi:serine/threonine protein kinase
MSNVIGEGTYGCVHKPSLECDTNKQIDYANKISKILTSQDADTELAEYGRIENIDMGHNFYLGVPEKCKVAPTPENVTAIKKCKNGKSFLQKMDKLSLLLLVDGGVNLVTFADQVATWPTTAENTRKMEMFWIEAHRLLVGLKAFLDNGIIHHDLKPQNIVYNESNNRLNFIDFGLMTTKDKLVDLSTKSTNYLARYHWSFPFEIEFLNHNIFTRISNKPDAYITKYYDALVDNIKKDLHSDITYAFRTFFTYIISKSATKPIHEAIVASFLTDFYQTLMYEVKPGKYDEVLNKSLDTIDIYGTGMALMYVLIKSSDLIDVKLLEKLVMLFQRMVTADLSSRITIGPLINEYEDILFDCQLLDKYNKHFENNQLVDGPTVPKRIEKSIESIDKEDVVLSQGEINDVVLSTIYRCPPEKEYNPKSKRCVKKCKDGYSRSADFKCKKNKTVKIQKEKRTKSAKACPEGKIRNEKTGRCVKDRTKTAKVCPEGKIRNEKTGRCVKDRTKTEKVCPEGKIRNEKTGRCIKDRTKK